MLYFRDRNPLLRHCLVNPPGEMCFGKRKIVVPVLAFAFELNQTNQAKSGACVDASGLVFAWRLHFETVEHVVILLSH